MTLHRSLAVALALSALLANCVLPGVGVGAPCAKTSECLSENVCVLLDETDPESDAVCLPMLELPSPQACFADEDCPAALWPVDASCNDEGRCTCEDFDASSCPNTDDVIGEHTCRCLPLAFGGDDCEDDNQCIDTLICGNGTCTDGFSGDPCDSDADCGSSENFTCDANVCV